MQGPFVDGVFDGVGTVGKMDVGENRDSGHVAGPAEMALDGRWERHGSPGKSKGAKNKPGEGKYPRAGCQEYGR